MTALSVGARSLHAQPERRITPALALQTFDSAWTRIRDTHYDPAMRGVDWSAVRTELRPRAERAATVGELRAVLGDMLHRLGESHFGIIPREAVEALDAPKGDGSSAPRVAKDADDDDGSGAPGDVGITLRVVEGSVVVTRVEALSPAARAGVRTGWAVDSVGAIGAGRVRELLARFPGGVERREIEYRLPHLVARAFEGSAGSRVRATFVDETGARRVVQLVRRATPGTPVRFGNLPAMLARVERERVPIAAGSNACVGIIRFNVWMTPVAAALDSAVREVRDCRGIVLDLRGNPGGIAGMVMGVSGYFLDTTRALGVLRSRGNELRYNSVPRRVDNLGNAIRPLTTPLAIVVDELSASTSEIFAAGMQAVGRARIFGTPSAGQALPALATRLPTGDVMMHVISDFTDPDGRRVEGRGAVPDEVSVVTRAGLVAGRDSALEAAVKWVGGAQP